MKQNMGTLDRTIRVIVGVGILAFGIYSGSYWALVGLVPVLTGFVGFCPAYLPLGLSTCRR
ncbi:MAG: DUF2892 domain-containing protein [Verrucomicrobia bacterium]|jgi:hypothetical protein|nr:DUF2892 domain-containing protein [Verrucomicrobiota bacterium]